MMIENGDVLIIGDDIRDNIPHLLREVASNIEVQVQYHDLYEYFNFMSFSKSQLEKSMFPTIFTLKMSLSYTQHQVMQSICDALMPYLPELKGSQINLLGSNMIPYRYSPDFFLSKILNNRKIFYDISQYDLIQSSDCLDLYIVRFDEDYAPVGVDPFILQQDSKVTDVCERLQVTTEKIELFLYQQTQKAILKFLDLDTKLIDIKICKDILIGSKPMTTDELKLSKDKKLKVIAI